jgi:uncharacterized protein
VPIIIDGHNLIPKIPGLDLSAVDDEMQLIEMLQEICRVTRKKVEVYFDNAPPGLPRSRRFGNVTAHFIRQGYTADQAIQTKLNQLKRAASNWTVVSSDREVQTNARAARAEVYSAESFSALLMEALSKGKVAQESKEEKAIPTNDVEEWLHLFGVDED